jgi:hypothetical protein
VISSSRTKSKTPTSCSRIVIFGYFCGCVECKYIKSEELYITPEGYELSQLKIFPLFLTAFLQLNPHGSIYHTDLYCELSHSQALVSQFLDNFFLFFLDKYYYSITSTIR